MEENDNIYILVNYSIDETGRLEEIRKTYPNLVITRITTGIYTIQVPSGAEGEFDILERNLRYIESPVVY